MDGLLLIDKEPGCTSHDVVQQVRRVMGQKKVGHCGTLDPDATGLLLLTLGQATRLTRFLIRAPKVYEGTIRFGVETDTYDASGQVVAARPCDDLSLQGVTEAMGTFMGSYQHLTPAYSAKKVQGVKFYEMARRGEEVPTSRKEVTVYEFEPEGELADGRLRFRLGCSSGTYVRSLAHELGTALGCGAHLAQLRRLRIGSFQVGDAVDLSVLAAARQAGELPAPAWVPFDDIPLPFAEVVADAGQERRLHHGQTVLLRDPSHQEGDWVKLVDRRRRLIAVGAVVERIGSGGVAVVQPKIVFR